MKRHNAAIAESVSPPLLRTRRGLMFTALPAIALLAVLGALLAIGHRQSSVADRRAETRQLAAAAAANTRRFLDDQLAILATAAASREVRTGDPRRLRPYLLDVARGGRFSSGLAFVDARAQSLTATNRPAGAPPVDLSDRAYVKRALGGNTAVSDVLIARVQKRPILAFGYPTAGPNGKRNGVLVGTVALDLLDGTLRRRLFAPGIRETILDGANHRLVTDQPVRRLEPAPKGYPVAAMRRQGHGLMDHVETAKGGRILAFDRVPGTGWVVIIDRNRSALIGSLDRALWAEIAALALFALIGFLFTLATGRRLDALDRERERALSEQREIALTLQRSLLPDLVLPAGLEGAARYVPAQGVVAVGGDWFDLVAAEDGTVTLNVGDVAGHGLQAAATMGKLRSAARVEALRGSRPAEALDRLNHFAGSLAARPLATVAYAVLDPRTGVLRYALAGHPPPLLIRVDGSTSYLEGGRSPLLGVIPAAPRAEGEATLAPGDTLVVFTDGLVERPEASIDAGLAALAERATRLTDDLASMPERLLATVSEPRRDDAAVLAVRLAQPSSVAS